MSSESKSNAEFGQEYASWQLSRRANPLRRLIKSLYVSRLLTVVRGCTVDVGCGAGQILERLPAGSAGIEVNPVLVSELCKSGLDVRPAQADPDRIDLSSVAPGTFQTLVLSHVLEHFDDAKAVLVRLLADARRLGVARVVIVVPGQVGYRSDDTHRTFVDMAYIRKHNLQTCEGYTLTQASYFPGNAEWIGRWFVYHEMMLVFDNLAST